jgi:hypothetical protein
MAPRSAPSGGGALTTLDKALAIAAMVAALAGVAPYIMLAFGLLGFKDPNPGP